MFGCHQPLVSLVAGMVAGADSIDDMDLLRHGGMKTVFDQVDAPSTLVSHLRAYTHGHVKQLAAGAARFPMNLEAHAPLLPTSAPDRTGAEMVLVDVDDTVIEVFSTKKQGARIGYNNTRRLQNTRALKWPDGHHFHVAIGPAHYGSTVTQRGCAFSSRRPQVGQ